MKRSAKNYNRIVIKIGSSLLYSDNSKLDCSIVNEITGQISGLIKDGREVAVVSSGAIALGMSLLGRESRPRELAYLQAAAAVGQPELMGVYQKFFKQKQLNCSQLLLTWEDFDSRKRYLNAKNTLIALLKLGSVPIINENDTVSTDEIRFGDNDRLSALVSVLTSADLLIILSDVDGLLDKDKKTLIRLVDKITPGIQALACPTTKKSCVGGMVSKLEAAKISMDSGIPCVIANGRRKDIISLCVNSPEAAGTLFLPKKDYPAARMRWIAFSAKPKGIIIVDDGAKVALLNKKSLLAVGIISCEGGFGAGEIVSLADKENREFARGKVMLSSRELDKVKGLRYHKEIVHRDNIVIL